MPMYKRLIAISALLFWTSNAVANEWSVKSPAAQATLVELFTSQGCSSCPPADSWLSQFRDTERLFEDIVPIAYHVTYWDYLGWQDPFGQPSHNMRHRSQAAKVGAAVYTPGVFLQGREWRSWRRYPHGPDHSDGQQVGVLAAKGSGNAVQVHFTPQSHVALDAPSAYFTYLRKSKSTAVRAGENRGRQLEHHFIAMPVSQTVLSQRDGAWVGSLNALSPKDAEAVAIWIVNGDNTFVQATGGFVAPGPELAQQ